MIAEVWSVLNLNVQRILELTFWIQKDNPAGVPEPEKEKLGMNVMLLKAREWGLFKEESVKTAKKAKQMRTEKSIRWIS